MVTIADSFVASLFAAAILIAAPSTVPAQSKARPKTKPPSAAKRVPPASPALDASLACPQADSSCVPPAPRREFRGVWVATVRNIDWPSKPGLPPALQKAELIAILDRAAALHLNAIVFQVRPAADALYASKIEPWSAYLTGTQGLPPAPFWDPLAFAVKEAHARGLELHAWFNPYRAKDPSAKGPLSRRSIARRRPDLVRRYGPQLWMDPGEPAVRAYTQRVILDVVRRYDIDGVHLDDYFYPYPERRPNGSTGFPDERSWRRYRRAGGKLDRDDWRRRNVDRLIEGLHKAIAKAKPWVKFGVSPFGIWRPGNPETVTGFDAYAKLYADSRKWLQRGWVDYLAPQLYWRMDKKGQRFPDLLHWWAAEDTLGRHLWPGLYTGRVGVQPVPTDTTLAPDQQVANGGPWPRSEILAQVSATRDEPRAGGDIHFSMTSLMLDRDSVATALVEKAYARKALVPASPWLVRALPAAPRVGLAGESRARIAAGDDLTLTVSPRGKDTVRWWFVQKRMHDRWHTELVDGTARTITFALPVADSLSYDRVAISAIDRAGNEGPPVVLRLP